MLDGLAFHKGCFSPAAQENLLCDVSTVVRQAPFYRPRMPGSGRPFSVLMTCAGPLGWVADACGYRYHRHHPVQATSWPPIPASLLRLWQTLSDYPAPPQCCLINLYLAHARMGLHQDCDEEAMEAPVLSVSLGDTATFRMRLEGEKKSCSWRLCSGDVLVMSGAARRSFHGIDRIFPGSSGLFGAGGGRINITMRRVTLPAD